MINGMVGLDKQEYEKVVPMIRSADINTMFAMSVLKRMVKGKVYVDDKDFPNSCYIRHPYGMSLLYGETSKEDFYGQLVSYMLNSENVRNGFEWLQVYPSSLYVKMDEMLGQNLIKKNPDEVYENVGCLEEDKKVLEYQRINFIFNKEKYLSYKGRHKNEDVNIVITSEDIFNEVKGSVVPKNFWDHSRDFIKNGMGYSLLKNDIPASTAFSSYIIGERLELGIETRKEFQGLGFGYAVCAELIDYCLANGYEPVWSCNSGNINSRKLAHKLGFDEMKRVPYYRLPK